MARHSARHRQMARRWLHPQEESTGELTIGVPPR
jgi:hypothetical protein